VRAEPIDSEGFREAIMNTTPARYSGPPRANSRANSPEASPTFYVWIDGTLRHCLPAPDIGAAITWADEQYPYARQREIYRSFRPRRKQ